LIIHAYSGIVHALLLLSRIKNRRELNTKIKGPTLGDADELEDTLQWVKKAKKRKRELEKRTQGFKNVDNVVQGEYTERWSLIFL
jgi:U4/U6.U5 tri-snRNP-associated protein 1